VLFFQKESKSDTILKNRNNFFYLLVPDTMKEKILFSIENGQLVKTANDSLVQLNYLPGLNYEYKYVLKNEGQSTVFTKPNSSKVPPKKLGHYETLINGTSDYVVGKIRIQIRNNFTGKLMDELVFLYR
jgi:hypothetical protein